MNCRACGAENPDDMTFCGKCGMPLRSHVESSGEIDDIMAVAKKRSGVTFQTKYQEVIRDGIVTKKKTSTFIICPKCGTMNENSTVCKSCGQSLPRMTMHDIEVVMGDGGKVPESITFKMSPPQGRTAQKIKLARNSAFVEGGAPIAGQTGLVEEEVSEDSERNRLIWIMLIAIVAAIIITAALLLS